MFQIHRVLYSLMSTTSTLWNHLHRFHLAVYIEKCKEMGWMKYLEPQEIDGHLPLAFLHHTPFSQDVFLEVLVQWIVADNQVRHLTFPSKSSLIPIIQSIYVIEGRKFRNLLLFLWEGLEDKNIPHQTKIQTAIMRRFKEYYNILKEELAVSKFLINLLLGVHFFFVLQ